MPLTETVLKVSGAINETFTEIYPWFQQTPEVLNYRPKDHGWTIAEILEHITLASHFLLIVASKRLCEGPEARSGSLHHGFGKRPDKAGSDRREGHVSLDKAGTHGTARKDAFGGSCNDALAA